MHPADIQAAIKKRDYTQKQLAHEIGVSEMTVSKVIRHEMVSDKVMKAIAKAIHLDHRAVFPEYYFGPKRRSTSKIAA